MYYVCCSFDSDSEIFVKYIAAIGIVWFKCIAASACGGAMLCNSAITYAVLHCSSMTFSEHVYSILLDGLALTSLMFRCMCL